MSDEWWQQMDNEMQQLEEEISNDPDFLNKLAKEAENMLTENIKRAEKEHGHDAIFR